MPTLITDSPPPPTPGAADRALAIAGAQLVDPVPPAPKPGVKTSELYVKLLADALTIAYASGWIPTSGLVATVVAIIATQLTAMGYAVLRTKAKGQGVALTPIIGSTAVSLLVAGVVLAACSAGSTVRKDAGLGVVAAASCELSNINAQDVHDAGVLAADKVDAWISGTKPGDLDEAEARIAADLKRLQGTLLPCLIAGIITGIAGPANPSSGTSTASQALTAATPDAAHTVAIAFQLAARRVGMPPLSTPAGPL